MKKQKLVDDFVTVAGGIMKSIQGAKDLSKYKLRDKKRATYRIYWENRQWEKHVNGYFNGIIKAL